MMRIITDRSGKLSILLFGLLFGLLLLVFLVIEMGGAYQNYGYAESVLQRAANSAVENNMPVCLILMRLQSQPRAAAL